MAGGARAVSRSTASPCPAAACLRIRAALSQANRAKRARLAADWTARERPHILKNRAAR